MDKTKAQAVYDKVEYFLEERKSKLDRRNKEQSVNANRRETVGRRAEDRK